MDYLIVFIAISLICFLILWAILVVGSREEDE